MASTEIPDFGDLSLPENVKVACVWALSRLGYEAAAIEVAFALSIFFNPDKWTIYAIGTLSVYFSPGDELVVEKPEVNPISELGTRITVLNVSVPGMPDKDWSRVASEGRAPEEGIVVLQTILNALGTLEPK